jgi:hypothetical protein
MPMAADFAAATAVPTLPVNASVEFQFTCTAQ